MPEQEQNNEFENIQNVLQRDKLFGKKKRNLVEAILFCLIDFLIIVNINFVPKVQLILLTTSIPVIFYFSVTGIKNRSITQIIFAELKFRYRRRKLHLRSINYVRKQNNQIGILIEGESLAEKTNYIAKKLIKAALRK